MGMSAIYTLGNAILLAAYDLAVVLTSALNAVQMLIALMVVAFVSRTGVVPNNVTHTSVPALLRVRMRTVVSGQVRKNVKSVLLMPIEITMETVYVTLTTQVTNAKTTQVHVRTIAGRAPALGTHVYNELLMPI